MIRKLVCLSIGCLWIVLSSCNKSSSDSHKDIHKEVEASEISDALPLPEIPEDITDPAQRSEYAANHFWDALDLQNKSQVLDTAFMEQSFSNFIAILPYASEEARKESAKKLIDRCKRDSEVLRLVSWIAYKYLDEPNSPMRSEELYIPFLECLSTGDTAIPEDIRERTAFRLTQALKNRPGSKMPHFRVLLRDGRSADMLSLLGNEQNIVMFYDSDCEHCKEISERLAATPLADGVGVIAVDVAGDRQLWDEKKMSLPADWTVAFDLDNVEDRELFYLPALPTIYVVDNNGVIIAKDAML